MRWQLNVLNVPRIRLSVIRLPVIRLPVIRLPVIRLSVIRLFATTRAGPFPGTVIPRRTGDAQGPCFSPASPAKTRVSGRSRNLTAAVNRLDSRRVNPLTSQPPGRARQSRRQFLQTVGLLSAATAAPLVVPSTVLGANAPSKRINVGFIGCGNQSTIDLPAFLGHDDCQVLAVCDVNTASFGYKTPDQFLGRQPAQEKVNAFYAARKASGAYQGCDAYNDFREVLARPDIDAVAIVVPDHWHGLMVAMAAAAGKDMYCEKPLSLTVSQGQAMVRAVRQYRRVLQTGSHYRSSPDNRRACELVRNGRIGQVKRILTQVAEINATDPGPGWQPTPVPEGFDYEMWLGPAPLAPYHKDRCF